MMAGLDRERAARFSFLLGIPIITLAAAKDGLDIATGAAGMPAHCRRHCGLRRGRSDGLSRHLGTPRIREGAQPVLVRGVHGRARYRYPCVDTSVTGGGEVLSAASKKPNGSGRANGTGRNRSTGATRRQPSKQPPKTGGLDERSRRDIYGVVLCVFAIALAVAVARGSEGLVSDAIATFFRLGFGIGAYIIPVVVLLWGVSFFVRVGDISEGRVGLGLGLSVLALISMAAMRAPAEDLLGHGRASSSRTAATWARLSPRP